MIFNPKSGIRNHEVLDVSPRGSSIRNSVRGLYEKPAERKIT